MKAMFLGFAVAIVLAVGAAFVLGGLDLDSASVFSGENTRLGE
ncbi:MAG: hypothetical protein AAF220_10435 [Pseudomonadota bacterium]